MSMLDDRTLTQWLLADGGPAVRYRTATELLPAQERVDAAALADELLSSAPVRHWLAWLTEKISDVFAERGTPTGMRQNVVKRLLSRRCMENRDDGCTVR